MKQSFYASLFLGLGLVFTTVPTIAKITEQPEKKQASAKTVKPDNKKATPAISVAKKITSSKTKPELAKSKHDKTSNAADTKHSKTATDKENKYSKNATRDNAKNKHSKQNLDVADIKDTKHKKTKAQQLAEAKNAKDLKKESKGKHGKLKNQQVAETKEDKHTRKKLHQTVKTEQQDDSSGAETNEAIESSMETESEQTAVYEPEPQHHDIINNNPPLVASPTVTQPEKPLFSAPSPPVQHNTGFFNPNQPVAPQAAPRPIDTAPKQPLISEPTQVAPNNNQRVHTLINKGSSPQPFSNNANEEESIAASDDEDNTELHASLPNNRIHSSIAHPTSNFINDANTQETSSQIVSTHGVVEGSLAEAGAKAGLSEDMMVELTEVFAWDIDFANNLQAGDQFAVVYDNNATGKNRIVAAEFINRGKTYRAIRYKNQEGMISYYAPDGHSLKKAFLTTPVDFARVSSHFSPHRHHPILNRIRAHKGVDYAARTGTPVKAAGDGVVTFRGTQGGYGNMIVISHGEHYETAYAHLSNFHKNLQEGQPVKQGEIIGYVGQTGLATGPHLHYEFRVDGVHKDPEKLDSSQGMRLAGEDWDNFHSQTVPILLKLNAAKNSTVVAENQPNRPNND